MLAIRLNEWLGVMATSKTDKLPGGGTKTYTVYADDEIRQAWEDQRGQGNAAARSRSHYCVVRACSEEQALAISHAFMRCFASPSCCHYDGETVSLYCGDAGRGWSQTFACADRAASEVLTPNAGDERRL